MGIKGPEAIDAAPRRGPLWGGTGAGASAEDGRQATFLAREEWAIRDPLGWSPRGRKSMGAIAAQAIEAEPSSGQIHPSQRPSGCARTDRNQSGRRWRGSYPPEYRDDVQGIGGSPESRHGSWPSTVLTGPRARFLPGKLADRTGAPAERRFHGSIIGLIQLRPELLCLVAGQHHDDNGRARHRPAFAGPSGQAIRPR